MFGGDRDSLGSHPVGRGNALLAEGLEILKGMFGGVLQEITSNVDSLVVREVVRGLFIGLAVE